MKNAVFCDIKTHFLPHRKHYVSATEPSRLMIVRFEVFAAVTMRNAFFLDVMPCGSGKNRRFGGTNCLLHQGDKIGELGTTEARCEEII
jgi:hypothetical protein